MPPKFDDFKKPAGDLLGNDFFVEGYEFQSKVKSVGVSQATATTTIDFNPGDEKEKPVPLGKISFKIPDPCGLPGICINKLEMDKKGQMKLEGEISQLIHRVPHLKLEGKLPNLKDYTGVTAGLTFHGLKMEVGNHEVQWQIKADVQPFAMEKSQFEITKSVSEMALFGIKAGLTNPSSPSFACRLGSSNCFGSLSMKQDPKGVHLDGHGFYKRKLPDGLGIISGQQFGFGASCSKKGTAAPTFGFGIHWEMMKGADLKAKVEQTMDKDKPVNLLSASAKYSLWKGCTLTAATKMIPNKPAAVGFQLSME